MRKNSYMGTKIRQWKTSTRKKTVSRKPGDTIPSATVCMLSLLIRKSFERDSFKEESWRMAEKTDPPIIDQLNRQPCRGHTPDKAPTFKGLHTDLFNTSLLKFWGFFSSLIFNLKFLDLKRIPTPFPKNTP